MCGIAGLITKNTSLLNESRLRAMTDVIAHRGPDGAGHWIDPRGQVGLGHRRLSIIDLSNHADQPMHYLDRYSMVFNGEIYNYIELRETLLKQGYSFRTASDTEVLMALFDKHGTQCFSLLDGMFSFVIFDAKEQKIVCARDRFGEKPFFYHHIPGQAFYFGSEMKCLWAGGVNQSLNRRMMFNYLCYGFLDNPANPAETFFTEAQRLPHAHYMELDVNTLEISITRYYDIAWQQINTQRSEKETLDTFRELFETSVKRRLRSDVPVGSSLSGGLDSSLVVCVIDQLKQGSAQKQNTFSAVFPGYKKDERKYMDKVIAQTRVEPHFITPNDEGLIRDFEKLCWHQEEPFGSASIYAQYTVMGLAKANNVTVLLDGQGADEILAGYHPYYAYYLQELKRSNPVRYHNEKKAYEAMHANSTINESVLGGWKNKVKQALPAQSAYLRKGYEWYKHQRSPFVSPDLFHTYFKESFSQVYQLEGLNHSLYHSTYRRGLQELLRYADRNSMAHSREVRLPFLSHELVDFLFTVPPSFKINEGWTKWLMREAYSSLLPKEIAWRTDKIGYEPPQKTWMEHAAIKEKTMSAKHSLWQEGIISKETAKAPYKAEDAIGGNNMNWKLLMAGALLPHV
ncbi:MAG: asparagine synthase (glutamine-hydrolyzing) [Chitinophagaceae bacterium]